MNRSSIHLLISGQVQGVGFRWFIAEHARRLGLAGWVRNLPSGEVEVVAAGEAERVSELEAIVAKGPMGARVDKVKELEPVADSELRNPFDILSTRVLG